MASIFGQAFSYYEKLASAKMESWRAAINNHNHSPSGTGSPISISSITIPNGYITGIMIAASTITSANISDGSILLKSLYTGYTPAPGDTKIHLSADGYAVYAP